MARRVFDLVTSYYRLGTYENARIYPKVAKLAPLLISTDRLIRLARATDSHRDWLSINLRLQNRNFRIAYGAAPIEDCARPRTLADRQSQQITKVDHEILSLGIGRFRYRSGRGDARIVR
jgi:hypothetical protein